MTNSFFTILNIYNYKPSSNISRIESSKTKNFHSTLFILCVTEQKSNVRVYTYNK